MHMRIDAMKVAAAVVMASNCRETVSHFANYTSSKGVSMETVETPLDPPLASHTFSQSSLQRKQSTGVRARLGIIASPTKIASLDLWCRVELTSEEAG